jgi:hypothetical protein
MTSAHEKYFWDETMNKIVEDLNFANMLFQVPRFETIPA